MITDDTAPQLARIADQLEIIALALDSIADDMASLNNRDSVRRAA